MFKVLEWLGCVVDTEVVGLKRSLRFLECEEIKTPFVGELKDKCDFILRLSLRSCLYMLSLWERTVRREVFMLVSCSFVFFSFWILCFKCLMRSMFGHLSFPGHAMEGFVVLHFVLVNENTLV